MWLVTLDYLIITGKSWGAWILWEKSNYRRPLGRMLKYSWIMHLQNLPKWSCKMAIQLMGHVRHLIFLPKVLVFIWKHAELKPMIIWYRMCFLIVGTGWLFFLEASYEFLEWIFGWHSSSIQSQQLWYRQSLSPSSKTAKDAYVVYWAVFHKIQNHVDE